VDTLNYALVVFPKKGIEKLRYLPLRPFAPLAPELRFFPSSPAISLLNLSSSI
jgi:hypothetical protein